MRMTRIDKSSPRLAIVNGKEGRDARYGIFIHGEGEKSLKRWYRPDTRSWSTTVPVEGFSREDAVNYLNELR